MLGPTSTSTTRCRSADGCGCTRPSTSVVLVRDGRRHRACCAEAMQPASATSSPPTTRPRSRAARRARLPALHRPARPRRRRAHTGPDRHRLLPQGRRRQDHDGGQPRARPRRQGRPQVCLVDLDLAFGDVAITLQLFPSTPSSTPIGSEDALDFPLLETLLTRHPDSLIVLAAPTHPEGRDRVSPVLVSRILRALRETSTTSSSTPPRPSTSRCWAPSTRPTSASSSPPSTSRPSRTSRSPSRPSTCSTSSAATGTWCSTAPTTRSGSAPDKVEEILGMDGRRADRHVHRHRRRDQPRSADRVRPTRTTRRARPSGSWPRSWPASRPRRVRARRRRARVRRHVRPAVPDPEVSDMTQSRRPPRGCPQGRRPASRPDERRRPGCRPTASRPEDVADDPGRRTTSSAGRRIGAPVAETSPRPDVGRRTAAPRAVVPAAAPSADSASAQPARRPAQSQPRTGSRTSRRACTPSCSSSSVRSCTTPTSTSRSSTSGPRRARRRARRRRTGR